MKTIVVPVDFSTHSEYALKVAAQLAKQKEAKLIVVHMMDLVQANLVTEDNSIDGLFYIKLTKKRFEEFLNKDYLKGINIQQEVKNYKIFSELNDVAKLHEADLIIMGSHGSSGLQEVFVGSNTEKVVRTSEIPVLVIKDDSEFNVKKAVFACDFAIEGIASFKKNMALFEALNIEPKMVYINQPGSRYLSTKEIDKRILDFIIHLTDYKLSFNDVTVYSDYSVEKGVFNYAEKIKADLISIPTHGRKGLAHFFSGSIGEDIVNHSKLPVLTIRI